MPSMSIMQAVYLTFTRHSSDHLPNHPPLVLLAYPICKSANAKGPPGERTEAETGRESVPAVFRNVRRGKCRVPKLLVQGEDRLRKR